MASPNNYGDINISKSIFLFGAGINSRRPGGVNTSELGSITISSSNVFLDGIRNVGITFDIRNSPGQYLQNFSIKNCIFQGTGLTNPYPCVGGTLSNLIIENSIIISLGLNSDCVTFGNISVRNSIIERVTAKNASFENCLIGGSWLGYGGGGVIDMAKNCMFKNCMFLKGHVNVVDGSIQYTNFTNCLTFNVQPNANTDLSNANNYNTSSGTVINADPLFTNGLAPIYTLYAGFLECIRRWNPILSASSPAKNTGSDGGEIGVYGGPLSYDFTLEPNGLPIIRSMDLQNGVIAPNGTLQIKSTATKAVQ